MKHNPLKCNSLIVSLSCNQHQNILYLLLDGAIIIVNNGLMMLGMTFNEKIIYEELSAEIVARIKKNTDIM